MTGILYGIDVEELAKEEQPLLEAEELEIVDDEVYEVDENWDPGQLDEPVDTVSQTCVYCDNEVVTAAGDNHPVCAVCTVLEISGVKQNTKVYETYEPKTMEMDQIIEKAKDKAKSIKGVGAFARGLISQNPEAGAEEIVAKVKAVYPMSKFDESHYKYYAWQVRRAG